MQAAESSREPTTLIVLIGPAAALSVDVAFGPTQPAGTISVPELQRLRSPMEEELGSHAQNHIHTFSLLQCSNNTLIACTRRQLPPEQAVTWADTVLAALKPASVVIASSILSLEYRGPGDAAEENLIFELHTSTARPPRAAAVPSLPPGTLITGLPAALLQACEVAGLPATALTAVESSPVPEVSLVCALADAVCGVAGLSLLDDSQQGAVSQAVDGVYRSSASNSMFI